MVAAEAALANAEADLGLLPAAAADAIAALDVDAVASFEALATGVREAGVPVPALVGAMRAALEPWHREWVHWGATSQDIVDTAVCLCCRDALNRLDHALEALMTTLIGVAESHVDVPMLARTRGQLATPISLGLRIAQWTQPLAGLREEAQDVRRAALRIQFGGASGSRQVVAPHGAAIAAGMAAELGLADGPPWHADRGGLRRLAGWLLRLVSALAKIGWDVSISSRGEVAEIAAGDGGGSSTMPHKSNPVRAEALQSMALVAMACETGLAAASVHAEERDGAMWAVEWALLPCLRETAGAALEAAQDLVDGLTPDPVAMRARIEATPGALAEAAVFALAGATGRTAAETRVKGLLATPESFLTELSGLDGVDWSEALSAEAFTSPASEVARDILRRAKGVLSADE